MSEVEISLADTLVGIVPDELQAEAFTDEKKIAAFIEKMTAVVDKHKPDVSTTAGRDAVKSLAYGVSKAKTKLDNHGKAITEDWRKKTGLINAARKTITTQLDALRDKARAPVTKWEQEKAEREAAIKERIDGLQFYIDKHSDNSEVLQEYLNELADVQIDASFGELRDEAYAIHKRAVEVVTERLTAAKQKEADQAELEALRIEKAKRDAEEEARLAKERAAKEEADRKEEAQRRKEAEAKRLAEAADRAKAEAEKEAQRKIEKAEADAKALVEAEREKAAKAEAARLAKIAAEEEAQRKRDQNMAHRKKINNAASKALMSGAEVDEATAKKIVVLIASGEIPNITIKY